MSVTSRKSRITALLLSLLMLSAALSSCKGPAETEATQTDTSGATQAASALDTSEKPEIPPGSYFDGYELFILCSGTGIYNDFSAENNKYSVVTESINLRNARIEEAYGVKIKYFEKFANSFGNGPGFQAIAADYAAGTAEYDFCEVGTYDAPALAVAGYLFDLNNVPYINLNKSWWDQNANADLCIQGKMYYTTGDFSVINQLCTRAMLFNKSIAADNSITDLYSSVEQGTWTLDKLDEYVKLAADDLDGNNVMTVADRYGLLCSSGIFQAGLVGGEQFICKVDDGGNLYLSLYTEISVDIAEKITSLCFNHNYVYNYQTGQGTKAGINMFANNQALFIETFFANVDPLRDAQFDYGILPYPKYRAEQKSYGSYVTATNSVMLCIESVTDDISLERTGILLEAIAYESQQTVKPAFFEQTLVGKYIRDDESVISLDIIYGTRRFDVGIYYLIGDYTGKMTNVIMLQEINNFTQMYNSYKSAAEAKIALINESYAGSK